MMPWISASTGTCVPASTNMREPPIAWARARDVEQRLARHPAVAQRLEEHVERHQLRHRGGRHRPLGVLGEEHHAGGVVDHQRLARLGLEGGRGGGQERERRGRGRRSTCRRYMRNLPCGRPSSAQPRRCRRCRPPCQNASSSTAITGSRLSAVIRTLAGAAPTPSASAASPESRISAGAPAAEEGDHHLGAGREVLDAPALRARQAVDRRPEPAGAARAVAAGGAFAGEDPRLGAVLEAEAERRPAARSEPAQPASSPASARAAIVRPRQAPAISLPPIGRIPGDVAAPAAVGKGAAASRGGRSADRGLRRGRRRSGRAVDCTGLENRRGRKPSVGSNPTSSATRGADMSEAWRWPDARPTWGPALVEGGARFRLWAPAEQGVRLRLDGADHPMRRDGEGWLRGHAAGAGRRSAYGFVLDDGTLVPDPAARAQAGGRARAVAAGRSGGLPLAMHRTGAAGRGRRR